MRRVERKAARRLATLSTSSFPDAAPRGSLPKRLLAERKILPIRLRTSIHRYFGILSASVVGSIIFFVRCPCFRYPGDTQEMAKSPSTVCLKALPSLGLKMYDWETKAVRVPSKKGSIAALRPVFRVRWCTSGRAVDLLERAALRSNLSVVQQDHTLQNTIAFVFSPSESSQWRRSNPHKTLPYPAWASSSPIYIAQKCTLRIMCGENAL